MIASFQIITYSPFSCLPTLHNVWSLTKGMKQPKNQSQLREGRLNSFPPLSLDIRYSSCDIVKYLQHCKLKKGAKLREGIIAIIFYFMIEYNLKPSRACVTASVV